jgi:chorismate mutase
VELRKKIDSVDEKIILLLKERMELCKSIGSIKENKGLTVRDYQREGEVYLHVMAKALEFGLSPQKIEDIFKKIIALGLFVQGAE